MDLTEKATTPARKRSGHGQKLALAVALISGAPILLLDEPTLGLMQASLKSATTCAA